MKSLCQGKWRNKYLTVIKENRAENVPIIYFDETLVDTHHTEEKRGMILQKNIKPRFP